MTKVRGGISLSFNQGSTILWTVKARGSSVGTVVITRFFAFRFVVFFSVRSLQSYFTLFL